MKIIYNNILPFPGFVAMAFFGVIFARKKYKPLSTSTINHEKIHQAQAKDVGGYLPFYVIYLAQWIKYGYKNAPFEVEAYNNGGVKNYLKNRPRNAWKNYKR